MSALAVALDAVTDVVTLLPMPAPDPGGGEPPPGSEGLLQILRWAFWIASALCVLGVMIAGGAMALAIRGHGMGGENVSRLGWVLAGCIVIGSASALVGTLLPGSA